MSEEATPPPKKTFDAKAAIRQYKVKNVDWDAILATTVEDVKNKDWTKIAGEQALKNLDSAVWKRSLNDALSTATSMRESIGQLDYELQDPALRAVDANVEWLEAEERKQKALAKNDARAATEAEHVKQQREREIASFELLKGMHEAAKTTSQTLGEIKSARESADEQQKNQNKFNKGMTIAAIILAAGSFIMPFVEEYVWKDPPAKPAVVVVQESDLTIPPLLRSAGP